MRKQRRRISCFARTLLPVFPSQGCCEEPSIPALSSPCVFSALSAPPPPSPLLFPSQMEPSPRKCGQECNLVRSPAERFPASPIRPKPKSAKKKKKKKRTWGPSSWNKSCKQFTFQKKNYQPLRELPPKWRPKILFFCFSCSLGQNPLPLALL